MESLELAAFSRVERAVAAFLPLSAIHDGRLPRLEEGGQRDEQRDGSDELVH